MRDDAYDRKLEALELVIEQFPSDAEALSYLCKPVFSCDASRAARIRREVALSMREFFRPDYDPFCTKSRERAFRIGLARLSRAIQIYRTDSTDPQMFTRGLVIMTLKKVLWRHGYGSLGHSTKTSTEKQEKTRMEIKKLFNTLLGRFPAYRGGHLNFSF